jgi:CRP/FNR family transcriptional activator FtrB
MYDPVDQTIEVATPESQPISISPDLGEIRSHPLFNGLSDDFAEELLSSCTAVQYRAGTTIVSEGERIAGLHIVHRGLVDLAHIDGDHETGVLLLSTKDLLLPGTTLFDESSLVSARALTTTKIVIFEQAAVRSIMASSSVLATNILKAMSGQWRMAVRNILDLNCRTAAQRLASFLLRLADLQSDLAAPSLPIAKRHLAARLGMTAETLSRMLQVVAQNGLYLRGRTIIIHDRGRIEQFCGPDPYSSRDDAGLNTFAL